MSGVHIDSFSDPGVYKIVSRGKEYLFDFSDRFGPARCKKNGDICENWHLPGHTLDAITLWRDQGKCVDANGYCVWDEKPKLDFVHIAGRHWIQRSAITQELIDLLRKKGIDTAALEFAQLTGGQE